SRSRFASADECVARAVGRGAAALVCGAGVAAARARRRPIARADHWAGRSDHSAGSGGIGGGIGSLSGEPGAAAGWGTPAGRKKDPAVIPALQELVAPETAGDPMSEQKWVRSSLRTLSTRLKDAGHAVSAPTVGRLLRELGYALHVNAKQVEGRSHHPDRQAQFAHLAQQRQVFRTAGLPVISVDTKKKELIGNFKNAGQAGGLEPTAVNVHDFLSDAAGRAVPYGIYDLT